MDEKVSAISIGNSAIKTKAILKCVVGDSTDWLCGILEE